MVVVLTFGYMLSLDNQPFVSYCGIRGSSIMEYSTLHSINGKLTIRSVLKLHMTSIVASRASRNCPFY